MGVPRHARGSLRMVRANRWRIQERAVMGNLLPAGCGLRYTGRNNDPGAQTGRPGAVGPVGGLLGGTTPPAALFHRLGLLRSWRDSGRPALLAVCFLPELGRGFVVDP